MMFLEEKPSFCIQDLSILLREVKQKQNCPFNIDKSSIEWAIICISVFAHPEAILQSLYIIIFIIAFKTTLN